MSKILIIGGGVSGLSAGIYARMGGHEVIICERGAMAGGNLTGWQRGEYHIDNCIHWLTGTNPATDTYKMWETLGALGGVEIMQGKSLYTYDEGGKRLSLYCDLDRTEREMIAVSPRDEKEIREFISAVRTVQGLSGIAGEKHNEGLTLFQKIKSLPQLYKYYNLSTGELAAGFRHPLLQKFIVSFLGNDFGSLALVFIFAHYCGNNGGIPRGSSRGMAQRMEKRFISLGGRLVLNKEAVKVNVKNGKAYSVSFGDGDEMGADYVIITTDPALVFGGLLDADMPGYLASDYSDKRKMRFSGIHCAFALDLANIPFEGDIIFEIPPKYKLRLGTENLILREFSHEPSFAPSGKNILQTVIFCNEENALRFIALRRDRAAYNKEKAELSRIIADIIVNKFPEMKDKLKCIDVWTPATYKRFINSEMGSFMSFALPSRCLPMRKSNKIRGLENVILATQWQQIPGGLPIAAEGGRLAVKTVAELEKKHVHKKQEKHKNAPSHA